MAKRDAARRRWPGDAPPSRDEKRVQRQYLPAPCKGLESFHSQLRPQAMGVVSSREAKQSDPGKEGVGGDEFGAERK